MGQSKQKFHVSYSKNATFKDSLNSTAKDGQRAYIEYRDLGLSEATGGKFHAHIGRAKPGFTGEKHTRPHRHHVDFQMIYVLKGWTKMIYEGTRRRIHLSRRGYVFSTGGNRPRCA